MDEYKKKGKVLEIILYREKGMKGETVLSAFAGEKSGLEGDWHGENQERQVTILPWEAREKESKGFCLNKFKENIRIQGLDISHICTGGQLRIGEVVIQVTNTLKKCYPEICSLAAHGEKCALKEQCIFGKIIQSGTIYAGDEVAILKAK